MTALTVGTTPRRVEERPRVSGHADEATTSSASRSEKRNFAAQNLADLRDPLPDSVVRRMADTDSTHCIDIKRGVRRMARQGGNRPRPNAPTPQKPKAKP